MPSINVIIWLSCRSSKKHIDPRCDDFPVSLQINKHTMTDPDQRYSLQEKIGKGSFGDVWKGYRSRITVVFC